MLDFIILTIDTYISVYSNCIQFHGRLEDCISDVRAWLLSHKLMFKDSKTEFLVIGTP